MKIQSKKTDRAKVPLKLLRIALEEHIRMGPEASRPVEERLARRARNASAARRAAALAQARRAVAAAEALAREYQDKKRTQAGVYAELRRKFPWLGGGDPAVRLGDYGYFLVIM
jgi:hypothetical protein